MSEQITPEKLANIKPPLIVDYQFQADPDLGLCSSCMGILNGIKGDNVFGPEDFEALMIWLDKNNLEIKKKP